MSTLKSSWMTVLLAVAVGVLGTLLVVKQGDVTPTAFAQVSPGVVSGNAVAMLGERNNDMVPLFLVDTKQQTVLVYEFSVSRRRLYLRVARSFAADRELMDNSWGNQNEGPTVKDVQNILRNGK
jgi:hypothetical protein